MLVRERSSLFGAVVCQVMLTLLLVVLPYMMPVLLLVLPLVLTLPVRHRCRCWI